MRYCFSSQVKITFRQLSDSGHMVCTIDKFANLKTLGKITSYNEMGANTPSP